MQYAPGQTPNVRGGPIASNITSLVYDDVTGALYIGNLGALNIMYANGSVARVDGLKGLPYGEWACGVVWCGAVNRRLTGMVWDGGGVCVCGGWEGGRVPCWLCCLHVTRCSHSCF